jgi:hypothetical protein
VTGHNMIVSFCGNVTIQPDIHVGYPSVCNSILIPILGNVGWSSFAVSEWHCSNIYSACVFIADAVVCSSRPVKRYFELLGIILTVVMVMLASDATL